MVSPITARGLARQQSFMDAATDLFLEKGYSRTTLSDIVERSKGSRATLYKQFGSKEGLLRKIVEDVTERVWVNIRWDDTRAELTEDSMTDIGLRFMGAALTPGAVSVYRILVAEGHLVPDIADFFYEIGPRIFQNKLIGLFQRAQDNGAVFTASVEDMAEMFMGAVIGDSHLFLTLPLTRRRRYDDPEPYIRAAVRVFLKGIMEEPVERD